MINRFFKGWIAAEELVGERERLSAIGKEGREDPEEVKGKWECLALCSQGLHSGDKGLDENGEVIGVCVYCGETYPLNEDDE